MHSSFLFLKFSKHLKKINNKLLINKCLFSFFVYRTNVENDGCCSKLRRFFKRPLSSATSVENQNYG